jgi:hypothetical protein
MLFFSFPRKQQQKSPIKALTALQKLTDAHTAQLAQHSGKEWPFTPQRQCMALVQKKEYTLIVKRCLKSY